MMEIPNEAVMSHSDTVQIELDLSSQVKLPIIGKSSNDTRTKIKAYANGLATWLLTYYFSSKIKKAISDDHCIIKTEISKPGFISITCEVTQLTNHEIKIESDMVLSQLKTNLQSAYQKLAYSALKKIIVLDLGYMNAIELMNTIPETDSEGRGMNDLKSMEKKLSVKVIFDHVTQHVYLVGDAKKLDKKCFALKNMLSHYYWRLSGNDVNFNA